jgi:hypothetical protein
MAQVLVTSAAADSRLSTGSLVGSRPPSLALPLKGEGNVGAPLALGGGFER